jgi:hypothetical protein
MLKSLSVERSGEGVGSNVRVELVGFEAEELAQAGLEEMIGKLAQLTLQGHKPAATSGITWHAPEPPAAASFYRHGHSSGFDPVPPVGQTPTLEEFNRRAEEHTRRKMEAGLPLGEKPKP